MTRLRAGHMCTSFTSPRLAANLVGFPTQKATRESPFVRRWKRDHDCTSSDRTSCSPGAGQELGERTCDDPRPWGAQMANVNSLVWVDAR